MHNTIVAEKICKQFGDRSVLTDVSFSVEEGTTFGLLGRSGAGKTTLIRILMGQLRQDSGYATLSGQDTSKLCDAQRAKIGTMTDDFGLYERLSVYDNLAFYADIARVQRSRIGGLLQDVGLYEARNCTVAKLSKGMKNRLSLARATIHNPKLLFLDEPTSGVDPGTAQQIHALLAQRKKAGTTIFLTTHNMTEAENECDCVAILNQGRIVAYGKPADIYSAHNENNRLRITLRSGRTCILENGSASAQEVAEYLKEDQIAAIHSTEPTLESVFLKLTGRGLD